MSKLQSTLHFLIYLLGVQTGIWVIYMQYRSWGAHWSPLWVQVRPLVASRMGLLLFLVVFCLQRCIMSSSFCASSRWVAWPQPEGKSFCKLVNMGWLVTLWGNKPWITDCSAVKEIGFVYCILRCVLVLCIELRQGGVLCLIISGLFGLAVCLIWSSVAEHKFCRPLASTLHNHGNWLGTDSSISHVNHILAHLRRVADQHL